MAIDWTRDPLFGRILADLDAGAVDGAKALTSLDTTTTAKLTELMQSTGTGGGTSVIDLTSIGDMNYSALITNA